MANERSEARYRIPVIWARYRNPIIWARYRIPVIWAWFISFRTRLKLKTSVEKPILTWTYLKRSVTDQTEFLTFRDILWHPYMLYVQNPKLCGNQYS